MMSSDLIEYKGFTPVIDVVVEDVGLMTAVVYGRMWRYCQMDDRVCRASMEKIADEVGISTRTARRHAKKLCKHGYLRDTTPDVRNRPHIYIDTGKVVIRGLIEAREGSDRESDQADEGYDRESDQGMTESPMKKALEDSNNNKDTTIKDTISKQNAESNAKFESYGFGKKYHTKFGDDGKRHGPPTGDEPWLTWGGERVHPRGGISAANLRRVGWVIEQVTGFIPESDRLWKRWRKNYEDIYKEAEGDFNRIREAVRNKWIVPKEKFRTYSADRILDEIGRLKADEKTGRSSDEFVTTQDGRRVRAMRQVQPGEFEL